MKKEGTCPHCKKNKTRFEIFDRQTLKRSDSSEGWYPLFKEVGSGEWAEDWRHGVAVRCKCGRFFFMHNLEDNELAPEVTESLKPGLSLALFCENCGSAFISRDLKCNSCGTQY